MLVPASRLHVYISRARRADGQLHPEAAYRDAADEANRTLAAHMEMLNSEPGKPVLLGFLMRRASQSAGAVHRVAPF